MEKNVRKIAALGDSLTAGYGVPFGRGWFSLLTRLCPEIQFYNYGISGDTTDGMRERCERLLRKVQPDELFFWGGSNDLLLGSPVTAILDNIQSVYSLCEACGTRLILLQCVGVSQNPGPYGWFDPAWAPYLREHFFALNQGIARLAEEKGLVALPLVKALAENPADPDIEDYLLPDGVHLNTAAHAAIADYILCSGVLDLKSENV